MLLANAPLQYCFSWPESQTLNAPLYCTVVLGRTLHASIHRCPRASVGANWFIYTTD